LEEGTKTAKTAIPHLQTAKTPRRCSWPFLCSRKHLEKD
jgi:hypothetical protein